MREGEGGREREREGEVIIRKENKKEPYMTFTINYKLFYSNFK